MQTGTNLVQGEGAEVGGGVGAEVRTGGCRSRSGESGGGASEHCRPLAVKESCGGRRGGGGAGGGAGGDGEEEERKDDEEEKGRRRGKRRQEGVGVGGG